MDMTRIVKCNVATCAYNMDSLCHTLGITVGPHAECNTYVHASGRGGFPEVKGGVGACLTANCKFNRYLECQAPNINVASHNKHADCEKFEQTK